MWQTIVEITPHHEALFSVKSGLSTPLLWFANKYPRISKILLRVTAKFIVRPGTEPHWLLSGLARILRYRIPLHTNLGNGMKITVPWNDGVGRAIHYQSYFDISTVQLVQRLLKPGMVFFDVGAHLGQYTLVGAQLIGSEGAVHSFEPDPDTFAWLSRHARAHHLNNVCLNASALGNHDGEVRLYLADVDHADTHSLSPLRYHSGTTVTVQCETLNAYVKAKEIRRLDVIKLDVEGTEIDVLRGASQILSLESRPILIVEFCEENLLAFGRSCIQLADLLRHRGYTLFRIEDAGLRSYVPSASEAGCFNVLCILAQRLTARLKNAGDLVQAGECLLV